MAVMGGLCLGMLAAAQPTERFQPETADWREPSQVEEGLGMLSLLNIPEVQMELRISAEQMQMVFMLQADLREQVRNADDVEHQGAHARTQEERQPAHAAEGDPEPASLSRLKQIEQTANALLSAILEPRQTGRLVEIWLQHEGVYAWVEPEVRAQLALSAAQWNQLDRLLRSATGSAAGERAMAVLTPEQRDQWAALQGARFHFPSRIERVHNQRFGSSNSGDGGALSGSRTR